MYRQLATSARWPLSRSAIIYQFLIWFGAWEGLVIAGNDRQRIDRTLWDDGLEVGLGQKSIPFL